MTSQNSKNGDVSEKSNPPNSPLAKGGKGGFKEKKVKFLDEELSRLKKENLYRSLRTIDGPQSPKVKIKGKTFILLSSNNYLGLINHPYIKRKSAEALKKYGTGSGASRLISGNIALYDELEKKIAEFKGCESSLVFSSGYAANIGTIPALAGKGDIIFSDELNHASIIDGSRLSGAKVFIYPHNDIAILEKELKKAGKYSRRIIITDSIFSMDGDLACLPEIVSIAEKYGAVLMVDDAHATGVLGAKGRGSTEYFNINGKIDVYMGTLSKAIGSVGGFIAGSKKLAEYLINKSRSFIYSTGLPPAALAASLAAFEIIEKDLSFKKRLWKNVSFLKTGLDELGYDTMNTKTQIIPVLLKSEKRTLKAMYYLYEKRIFLPGIRPPTVPENKCRLRATVMATHTKRDLEYVLEVFRKMKRVL